MNIVYALLVAFPLGYVVPRLSVALLGYLLAGSWLFTYQSVGVLLDWLSDSRPVAFGPSPTQFPISYSTSEYVGYGVVNLVATLVGIGLLVLGHRVATRRRTRRAAAVVA